MSETQKNTHPDILDLDIDVDHLTDRQQRIIERAADIEDARMSRTDPDRPTIDLGLPEWLEVLIIVAARIILYTLIRL